MTIVSAGLFSDINVEEMGLGDLDGVSSGLANGISQLISGSDELTSGLRQLSDGAGDLASGAGELSDGAEQLSNDDWLAFVEALAEVSG